MNNQQPLIAIIGATDATGKYVLQGALERGYAIRVLARTPEKLSHLKEKVEIVKGSVDDMEAVKQLFEGVTVIISTLGTNKKPNYIVEKGVQTMLQVIHRLKNKPRFIHMSAVGLGNSIQQCKNSWLWTFIVKVTFPLVGTEIFADMERAEQLIIADKHVKWVIARAAILDNKLSRGYITRLAHESTGKMFISRQDIAEFMLNCVSDTSFDGKAISLFSATK